MHKAIPQEETGDDKLSMVGFSRQKQTFFIAGAVNIILLDSLQVKSSD